jgi:hypothetical protein
VFVFGVNGLALLLYALKQKTLLWGQGSLFLRHGDPPTGGEAIC